MAESKSKSNLREKLAGLREAFLRKLPERLVEAEEAWRKALESRWDAEACAAAHRIVHSLAGSSATFGLTTLSGKARKLEGLLNGVMEGELAPSEELEAQIRVHLEDLKRTDLHEAGPAAADSMSAGVEMTYRRKDVRADRDTKTVFLVDDDPVQLENLSVQISHFGYSVRTFSALDELRYAMRETTPAAIIIDIIFPEGRLAGVETVVEIQKGRDPQLPVIFISCRNDIHARLQAVKAGGEAYFLKPPNLIDIIDKLDELTTRKEPEPYRILIVDDDPDLAEYHASVLADAGMMTTIVGDPLKVLDPLVEFHPDLILMDMYMPACSGQQLARTIRQMGAYFSIPIVYLSTETDINRQLTAMSMGGDDFLTKPIQPPHLISSVAIRAERMRIVRSLMERDGLTGLLNHTKTEEQLHIALARAVRQKCTVSFAMVDLDRFKSVNDTYGHATGDRVLVAVSRLLQQRLRKTDVIGRYGGEEFAVILYDTDLDSAAKVLDNIRASFSQLKHQTEGTELTATFSCGVASYPQYSDPMSLRNAADKALYRAKGEGRDRVVKMSE
jgi:diguanylate cyclase (GGDEF)-like protein